MMVSHNLGVLCENPNTLPSIVGALMANNGQRLKEIRSAQRAYRDLDNAKNIARLIHDAAVSQERPVPKKRMMLISQHNRQAMKRHFTRMRKMLDMD